MGSAADSRRGSKALGARAVGALAVAVALWTLAGPSPSGAAEREPAPGRERILVIAEGDTLWDLAATHASGIEHRAWISQVTERNGVDPRSLRPGDIVRVPASE